MLAGDLLRGSQFYQPYCGRATTSYLLRELLDAHELVLSAALPSAANAAEGDRSWTRDFAVGHVVLTNERQWLYVSKHLMEREANRGIQLQARLESEAEEWRQLNPMNPKEVARIP